MKTLKIILSLMLVILLMVGQTYISADTDHSPAELLVLTYFDYLNAEDYGSIANLLHTREQPEYNSFISNEINAANHSGIFNYGESNVIDITSDNSYLESYPAYKYEGIVEVIGLKCIVDVDRYVESDYLNNGLNCFHFVIGITSSNEFCILGIIRIKNATFDGYIEQPYMINSFDEPVHDYSFGIWTTPSSIRVKGYGDVNFYEYCKNVTMNEVGLSSIDQNGRKAAALAIKNFGWNRTLVQKYPNYDYDVRSDTEDQVYDPNTTPTPAVTTAVSAIYNYVMLSCDYGLFAGFHCSSINVHENACYHGGILSQTEASELGENGYTWEEIVHYFYDFGSYNSEMTSGVIKVVNLLHTPVLTSYESNSFYHWYTCSECGRKHSQDQHIWVLNLSQTSYRCTICGRVSNSIPGINGEGDLCE